MRKTVGLIASIFLFACHAQTPAETPIVQVVVSVRSASILLQPFTIITVEEPQSARVRCADQEAQKTFRDMRELAEMIFAGRMIQPWEFYGVSYLECVCEGNAGYKVERQQSVFVVFCKKA